MYNELTAAQIAEIAKLYIAYFNRAPEHDGLQFHIRAVLADLNAGLSFEQAAVNRADQFYQAATDVQMWSPDQPSEWFIRTVYYNVLLRPGMDAPPTQEEVDYWVGRLENGLTRGGMVREFLEAVDTLAIDGTPEEKEIAARVQAALDNRVTVGLAFAQEDVSGGLFGRDAAEVGRIVLDGVTDDPATVEAALDWIAENAPRQLELTPGYDGLIGGWNADVFTATPADLGPSDYVSGGLSDRDELRIIDAGTEAFVWPSRALVQVEGIERLSIVKTGGAITFDFGAPGDFYPTYTYRGILSIDLGDASTIDIDTREGLGAIHIKGGGNVFIDDHASATDKQLRSISLDSVAGAVLIGGVAEVSVENLSVARSSAVVTIYSPVEERTLALSLDAVSGAIADAEATGLQLTSAGQASSDLAIIAGNARTVTVDAGADLQLTQLRIAKSDTLVLSGAANVTIDRMLGTSLKSIDATALSGDLNIATTLMGGTAFHGGVGDETIHLPLFVLPSADIRLGAGDDMLFLGTEIPPISSEVIPSGIITGGDGYDTLALNPFFSWTVEQWTAIGDMISGFERLQLFGWNTAYLDRIQPFSTIDATNFIGYIDQLASGSTVIGGNARAGMQLNADGSDTRLNLLVSDSWTSFESANLDHVAVNFIDGPTHTVTLNTANLQSLSASGTSNNATIRLSVTAELESIDVRGMGDSRIEISLFDDYYNEAEITVEQLTVLGGPGDTIVDSYLYGYFRILDLTVETGAGNDGVNLSAANGTISTGAGDDFIGGSIGAGVIDAGTGDDFVFAAGTIVLGAGDDIVSIDRTGLNETIVSDFNLSDDHIYTGVAADFVGNANDLQAAMALFTASGGPEVAYNRETDTLYYDRNGDGIINAENDLSIVLTGVAEISASHFVTQY